MALSMVKVQRKGFIIEGSFSNLVGIIASTVYIVNQAILGNLVF